MKKITLDEFNRKVSLKNCDASELKFSATCECAANCTFPIGSTIYMRAKNLRGAKLPEAKEMLLCNWGELSQELTQLCMAYDAAHHPNPELFNEWAFDFGDCPYKGCQNLRAVWFYESRGFWEPTIKAPTADELLKMLILEKCVDSDYTR